MFKKKMKKIPLSCDAMRLQLNKIKEKTAEVSELYFFRTLFSLRRVQCRKELRWGGRVREGHGAVRECEAKRCSRIVLHRYVKTSSYYYSVVGIC